MHKIVFSNGKTGCFDDAFKLRNMIFCDEQGFSTEVDSKDDQCIHMVIYEANLPIATGRYYIDNNNYHIGRICVLKSHRGSKIGNEVMNILEKEIASKGGKTFVLDAQEQAKEFYQKLGYKQNGEMYMDEHCPHIPMIKKIGTDE